VADKAFSNTAKSAPGPFATGAPNVSVAAPPSPKLTTWSELPVALPRAKDGNPNDALLLPFAFTDVSDACTQPRVTSTPVAQPLTQVESLPIDTGTEAFPTTARELNTTARELTFLKKHFIDCVFRNN
jgi:hypothetical protein